MIFVDTSAWYASVIRSDANHRAASDWFAANAIPLVTTDYIVDEILTLLRARGHRDRAIALGEALWKAQHALLHYVTENQLDDAWDVFRRFNDKDWSFTDCTSNVVMEDLGIDTAFAFDVHFNQFSVTVVP